MKSPKRALHFAVSTMLLGAPLMSGCPENAHVNEGPLESPPGNPGPFEERESIEGPDTEEQAAEQRAIPPTDPPGQQPLPLPRPEDGTGDGVSPDAPEQDTELSPHPSADAPGEVQEAGDRLVQPIGNPIGPLEDAPPRPTLRRR